MIQSILSRDIQINIKDGGKGVVSAIVDDDKMPIVIDKNTGERKRVEVVMNPQNNAAEIKKTLKITLNCWEVKTNQQHLYNVQRLYV